MHKLWLLAKHEYLKRVKKKSFLIALMGFPLLMVVIGGISILATLSGGDTRPIGIVDHAGVLDPRLVPTLQTEQTGFVEILLYGDETTASDALANSRIQAYYVVPQDYLVAKDVTLVHSGKEPGPAITEEVSTFLRESLLAQQSATTQKLLSGGLNLEIRSADGRRQFSPSNVVSFILPFVVTFLLFFAITTAGGYLLQAMTEEKENRTMEIITTSVSPEQLMGGKALGLIAVSLTQILTWVIVLIIGVFIAGRFVDVFRSVQVPWDMVALTILYFVPAFTLIAGIMITLGAAVTEAQQGQQIAGIINMLFVLPVFFLALLFSQPSSPFLTLLTFFPTTSFLMVLLRWSFATVPWWQLIVSWLLLTASALGSIWLGARVFRMGMLRYGQRLSLRQIVEGLRSPRALPEKETVSHA